MERRPVPEGIRAAYDDAALSSTDLLGVIWCEGDADESLSGILGSPVVWELCWFSDSGLGKLEGISAARKRIEHLVLQAEIDEDFSELGRGLGERALAGLLDYEGLDHEETEVTGDAVDAGDAGDAVDAGDAGSVEVVGAGGRELFVAGVFEEATSYLVWSEVSGLVGTVVRVPTVTAAHELERDLRRACWQTVVAMFPLPHLADASGFAFTVLEVSGAFKRLGVGRGNRDSDGFR